MAIERLHRTGLWAILALLLPLYLPAQTDAHGKIYNEEHPLIYEDAWNLWPYVYLNDHGEPEGYNVDLVKMLCEEMNIPYVIKLKSTREALRDLKEGRSDLMLGLDNRYDNTNLLCSKTIVQLFTHSVVYPKGTDVFVQTIEDLGRQQVVVHKGSFCHHLMEDRGWADNAHAQYDMKAAIKRISAEEKGQIVWNTMSLKWLLHKFQIENLQIQSVDMPHGAYKFMSNDSVLLHRIDEAYKELSMDRHRLEAIQNQWFYPEKVESGIPSWVWYATAAISLLTLSLLSLNVFYRTRTRKMTQLIQRNTQRLSHLLRISNMYVWTYDIASRTFIITDTSTNSEQQYTSMEFSRHFRAADFEKLCDTLRKIGGMEMAQATLNLKASIPDNGRQEERDYAVTLSVLREEKGMPAILLGTMNDVTEELKRQQTANTLLTRYKSIFETAMVDMIYYNEQGYIANMNQRAIETFGMDEKLANKLHANLREIVGDKELDLESLDYYHVTRYMNVYNQFQPEEKPKESTIYYEFQLMPVRDAHHKLLGVYGSGQEVTDFVNNWQQQKENIRKLSQAYQEVEAYIKNMDYVMKVGGIRVIKYSPRNHTMTFYSEAKVAEHVLTQSRCITLVAEKSKKRVLRLFDNMDNCTQGNTEILVKTSLKKNGHPIYLQINLFPIYNESGSLDTYFGMCRDVSEMKITELQLEKETKRAQDVEELKNSFLRNMSYEIRTPLNAVIGFAELFKMPHSQTDEEVFVREIKENAAYLLRLINDILFLSRLDAHMIEINRQPTDFAKTFEGHCQIGWANDQKENVRYQVVNHFEQFVVDIDDTNLGLMISQITANAAQHTTKGTVRARYDYIDNKLMVAVEDTGSGIPDKQMGHIFDRFSSGESGGTGLGLPICKELARQMGGHIDITSKVGNGTTVWIIIPCKLISMERKMENFITA